MYLFHIRLFDKRRTHTHARRERETHTHKLSHFFSAKTSRSCHSIRDCCSRARRKPTSSDTTGGPSPRAGLSKCPRAGRATLLGVVKNQHFILTFNEASRFPFARACDAIHEQQAVESRAVFPVRPLAQSSALLATEQSDWPAKYTVLIGPTCFALAIGRYEWGATREMTTCTARLPNKRKRGRDISLFKIAIGRPRCVRGGDVRRHWLSGLPCLRDASDTHTVHSVDQIADSTAHACYSTHRP